MAVVGLVLTLFPFFIGFGGFIAWIYGIPLLVIGIFILFNRKEDKIEGIKFVGGKKRKWIRK